MQTIFLFIFKKILEFFLSRYPSSTQIHQIFIRLLSSEIIYQISDLSSNKSYKTQHLFLIFYKFFVTVTILHGEKYLQDDGFQEQIWQNVFWHFHNMCVRQEHSDHQET